MKYGKAKAYQNNLSSKVIKSLLSLGRFLEGVGKPSSLLALVEGEGRLLESVRGIFAFNAFCGGTNMCRFCKGCVLIRCL